MYQVDIWIDTLPQPLSGIASQVRQMLLKTIDGIEEKYSYKLPFYHYFGMFCYLTYNRKLKALDVTFIRGKDLTELFPHLETRNRTTAASTVLYQSADIVRLQLMEIIITAAAWQQEARQLKIPFFKKRSL